MKYPTLSKYNSILTALDSAGNTKNTEELYKYLVNFAASNPRIRGHINMRATAVSSFGWEIVSPDGQPDLELSASLENVINLIIKYVSDVSLFGKLLIQLDWHNLTGEFIPTAKVLPVYTYECSNNTFSVRNGLALTPISAGDTNYIYSSDNYSRDGGIMRAIGSIEILRHEATLEWGNYNKKLKGMLQGIDKGLSLDERAIAADAMAKSMQNNYLLTNDLVDFKFHQLAASGAGDSFKNFIDYLNNSITIGILGQANTPELPASAGSRAALQIQAAISADIMWCDIALAESIINNQLLKYYALLNYGNADDIKLKFRVKSDEPEDVEKNITVIAEAISANIPLSKKEVYRKINFTPPLPNEEIFQLLT